MSSRELEHFNSSKDKDTLVMSFQSKSVDDTSNP